MESFWGGISLKKIKFLFYSNLNCCYESDRAYDVRRHIEGKKHAIVNRNNMNYASNTSNTLIDGNAECGGYANRRKRVHIKENQLNLKRKK